MGLLDFGGFGIGASSTPSIEDVIKTIETVDALITDQTIEGKKEGYADAASEYETVYADLKKKYDVLISNIEKKKADLDIASHNGIIELETLESERTRLKSELNRKAEAASKTFSIPTTSIFSALKSGSSAFFATTSLCGYDLRDSIITQKKKERMKARKEGYLEAKAEYEGKINQLKGHYRKTKADAYVKLSNYAEHVSDLLNEIETIKFQIADLKIAIKD